MNCARFFCVQGFVTLVGRELRSCIRPTSGVSSTLVKGNSSRPGTHFCGACVLWVERPPGGSCHTPQQLLLSSAGAFQQLSRVERHCLLSLVGQGNRKVVASPWCCLASCDIVLGCCCNAVTRSHLNTDVVASLVPPSCQSAPACRRNVQIASPAYKQRLVSDTHTHTPHCSVTPSALRPQCQHCCGTQWAEPPWLGAVLPINCLTLTRVQLNNLSS